MEEEFILDVWPEQLFILLGYKYILRCFSPSFTLSEYRLGQEDFMSSVPIVHWVSRPSSMTPSRWWVGSGGQVTAHLLLLTSTFTPLSCSITSKRLFLLPPPSCELLSFSPSLSFQWLWAFSTLTEQGILFSRPRPGTAMPAILSPCSHAEGLGLGTPPFKGLFTPLFPWDCKFYEDDHFCLRVVWIIWGSFSLPPTLTFICHDWAFCSRLVLVGAVVGGFFPPLQTGLMLFCEVVGVSFFFPALRC